MSLVSIVIITVSDSCFNNKAEDSSGPCLVKLVRDKFPSYRICYEIISDDRNQIEQALCKYSDEIEVQLILTTGGTGFSPRDNTPEATRAVIEKECPQLQLAMSLESLKKTPFAALSRAVCGIRSNTLIINLPGSEKAVNECFNSIATVLPHAIELITNKIDSIQQLHQNIQNENHHICPYKTKSNLEDRNSPYPMLPVVQAKNIILKSLINGYNNTEKLKSMKSPVNIPSFRASIKDGYALKSSGKEKIKQVLGYIAAGDKINKHKLEDYECFKINTGAPVPKHADCIVQIEDTKLIKSKLDGTEDIIEILIDPKPMIDIRPIGCDLKKNSFLFPSTIDLSDICVKSLSAAIGQKIEINKPRIAIISTGSELLHPSEIYEEGKIYDSNRTMLQELLKYFGFNCTESIVIDDDFTIVKTYLDELSQRNDFIICSGGVSMGDKDYIKPTLLELGFNILVGRVNMKPGKPMTFAVKDSSYFFGLPGNPVSAFVTFHIFVLPALRRFIGVNTDKCELARIQVILQNDQVKLDPRPEYARATITSCKGKFYAKITGEQMSSRLQSIVGADVLLHLPPKMEYRSIIKAGDLLDASVLRYDFISNYDD